MAEPEVGCYWGSRCVQLSVAGTDHIQIKPDLTETTGCRVGFIMLITTLEANNELYYRPDGIRLEGLRDEQRE